MSSVAIVDYGLGNLFSVRHACTYAGITAEITGDADEVAEASAIILPGVGAFGDAMDHLRDLELIDSLRSVAKQGKPLLGICLGMQLLLEGSDEFGQHEGLGLIPGRVERLLGGEQDGRRLKVPHIGWAPVHQVPELEGLGAALYNGVPDQGHFYFVHSYTVHPDAAYVQSTSHHGTHSFVAGIGQGNVVGMQFHPERSGPMGLKMYENLATILQDTTRTS